MNPTLFVVLILAVLVLIGVAWYRLRGRRQREMHLLLDSADAMEARLRTARTEIEAVAGETEADPVHEAMREMLRQRLWLREHGKHATVAELHRVRTSIDGARERIERQLGRIREARLPEA